MIATISRYARFCALVVLLLTLAVAAFAQSQATAENIEGRVLDPKGAAIPAVTVTATNQATGFEKSVATDSLGNYRVILLSPGSYDVKTSVPYGFAQDSEKEAYAKILAEELKNVGMDMSEEKIDEIFQAMIEGGNAAMAVAQFIKTQIAEIESDQKSQDNSSATKPGVQLSEKQIDDILQYLTEGKKSTLRLSQYLTSEFTQLKKTLKIPKRKAI